jgi:hypothetical protein
MWDKTKNENKQKNENNTNQRPKELKQTKPPK